MSDARLHTVLCDLLDIEYPIVQTGMGWVAVPELVAATSNAGGIGFLSAATLAPDELEPSLRRVRQLTDRPFGVNFLMEQPNADQVVRAVIDRGVRVVGYNRAPRADVIRRFKDAGVICMPTIGAVRHATKAVELGADVLIAQGGEGGGHTGPVPTSLLLPQVVDAVDVPVVAAGGFRDGRGLVAALAYGAVGIAMGTRFLLTRESPVTDEAKAQYLRASVTDTVVTRKVDGLPQRLLVNEFVDRLESSNPLQRFLLAVRSAFAYRKLSKTSFVDLIRAGLTMRRSERLTRTQMFMAANAPVLVRQGLIDGPPEDGVLPTGQVTGLIDEIPTCREVVEAVVSEAEETLAALTT